MASVCALVLSANAQDQATPAPATESTDKKVEGFGVIDRVISTGAEPVFQADGYRIYVVSSTVTKFGRGLSNLADVGTNTWVRYEGTRGHGNEIVSDRVAFEKPRDRKVKIPPPDALPTSPSWLDSDGNFIPVHSKYRLSDLATPCGWHKVVMDAAVQERVRQMAMKVMPAYQKALPDESSSKLHLRIYVVEEKDIRDDIACLNGIVLIPLDVVQRLTTDDQLAAIMADAVAGNIEEQSARLYREIIIYDSALLAADFLPYGAFASLGGNAVVDYEMRKQLREQSARISLTLMADAGYDPRQAPEAWRLLAPKKLPRDVNSLEYPPIAKYQMDMLGLPVR